MKVSILAPGSRGDVQPYLALGQGLVAAGHHVRVVTTIDHEALVKGHGLEVTAIPVSVEAALQSRQTSAAVEGGGVIASFRAFAELEAAARTDPMLRARLANAQSAFDRNQVGDRFIALTQAGSDPRFQTSRDLGRFLLEGLARGSMTYDEAARRERLIAVIKRAVRALNRKGEAQDLWVD